jgi:hypothetical protein
MRPEEALYRVLSPFSSALTASLVVVTMATVPAMRRFLAILMEPRATIWTTMFTGSFDCYSCTFVPHIRNINLVLFSLRTCSMSWIQATCITSSQRYLQRVKSHTERSQIMEPNLSVSTGTFLKTGNNIRRTSVSIQYPYLISLVFRGADLG